MLIFLIAVVIVVGIIVVGLVFAAGSSRLDQAVKQAQLAIENKDKGYNPAVTLGHRILVQADPDVQLKQARLLAAKRAAALPRGANMGIGRMGSSSLKTAGRSLENDPQTAVRIANFHGWDGARTGAVVTAPMVAPVAIAAAPAEEIQLIPGKDYPVTTITDDMSPAEKRKARIANAKAKSAAMKAAKGTETTAAPTAPASQATAPSPTAVPPAASAHLPALPTLIAITDDISPEEKRKARIANAKANSAYNKALKAAGGGTSEVSSPAAILVTPDVSAPAQDTEAAAVPVPGAGADGIAQPVYIELSEDMSPDEKRQARIQNAKARSAYNRALKAAGIDPATVN